MRMRLLWVSALLLATACTRESTRIAIESQRRADEVQQAVFDRQHEALGVLLYRDLVRGLEADGASLTAEQRAVANAAWNDRDLVEFWALQNERARALRLAGVDAKLYSDQAMIDLLWKSVEARMDRVNEGLAADVAAQAGEAAGG